MKKWKFVDGGCIIVGCIMGCIENTHYRCSGVILKKVSDMGHICPMSFLQMGVVEVSKTNTFTFGMCVHHHSKCISLFLEFAQKLS